MLNLLLNRRVGSRLGFAFSAIMLLLFALGGASIWGMGQIQGHLDRIVQTNNARVDLLTSMLDGTRQVAILMRNSVLRDDPEFVRSQMEQLKSLRTQFEADRSALEKIPADLKGKQLREQVYTARDTAQKINDAVLVLAAEDKLDEARGLLIDQGGPAMQAWANPLLENTKLQEDLTQAAYVDAQESYRNIRIAAFVIIAVALLTSVLLGWFITRSITQPLQQANKVAMDIAQGVLDGNIQRRGNDEVAQLLASMQNMQSTLRNFAAAEQEIAQHHQAGDIDFRISTSQFKGTYANMAEGVNMLVAQHIAVSNHVIETVSAYAKGDLTKDIKRYPGQQASITEAVDAVKSGMLAVNSEIKQIVDAAVAGDFSYRGDALVYDFIYRDLIEQLNELMGTADSALGELGGLLSALADGDLGQRIEVVLPGQFGQLSADANRTVNELSNVVGGIRRAADAISSGSAEIATGNHDLSVRTEQQAANLEETASTMEELTATVRQNAENARQANQLAIGAAGVAENGGVVVQQVVSTMAQIQQSSSRIADIISVIDGIAFQTNILALNAAVEAARAGEQGRGFAVVASEVRTLAQRSATAAKEINQLISDSVERVEEGNALVSKAGNTMTDVVNSVRRVNEIMSDISAASQEQSSGIEQVNDAIMQMDQGTQQNAALVEEASAAAESMRQQATLLVEAVSAFRGEQYA